jgi:hypothetical protein
VAHRADFEECETAMHGENENGAHEDEEEIAAGG